MTHRQLIRHLATRRSLPIAKARLAVEAILEQLRGSLARGERVDVRRFGAFFTRLLRARTNVHPRSGQMCFLPQRRMPAFRASPEWLARLNEEPGASSRLPPADDSLHT